MLFTKTKSKNLLLKAVSILLCFCIYTSILQLIIISANAVSEPIVTVCFEGEKTKTVTISESEKCEISAVCNEKGNLEYNWQVLGDKKHDLWIDIYDAKSETISVSNALLSGVLDNSGKAEIRATVTKDGITGKSEPVSVTVKKEEFENANNVVYTPTQNFILTTNEETASDILTIKINYLDAVTGMPIYTSFTAQIEKNTEHTQTVTSPTYLGYKPYYDPDAPSSTGPENCSVPADSVTVHIPSDYTENTYTVNVYYKAISVSYAVKYYFQNIGDDFYTEDSSLYKIGLAQTGTIINDSDLVIDAEGFTKLYHYPQTVAGDGSTVFECYYDRDYSMLKFDLSGGYGVEPIYARYGTPIVVGEPIRLGFVFLGWQLMDENGNYSENYVEIPGTVPSKGKTFKAVWATADTSYTIVYWLQNADDDNYEYIGVETRVATTGSFIPAESTLRSDTPICGNIGGRTSHAHTSNCYPQGFQHYIYDQDMTESKNTGITVSGDGSSVLNIYYQRQYYTLRFIYAKEYSPENDVEHPNQYLHAKGFSIVGGSTNGFGNKTTQNYWPNGKGNDYTLTRLNKDDPKSLMESLNSYENNRDKWGKINGDSAPKLNTDKYKTGVYPESGYDYYGDRYYYFDITARYGADLSTLWPTDVFEPISVPIHSQNGANNNLSDDGWGNYAYLAGWNGEYKVSYSLEKSNSTIKGLYQKLDSGILLGSLNGTQFSYNSEVENRMITTTATNSGEEVTSYLNYYLAFFNNGADVNWNIPREWNYEYYIPIFDGVLSDIETSNIKNAGKNKNTVTLSNGLTYYYYEKNETIYQLGAKVVTSDNNKTAADQTQCALLGYEFDYNTGLSEEDSERSQKIYNGKLSDNRESYTLRMFYKRKNSAFGMYNYNSYFKNFTLPFKTDLDQYVYLENGNFVIPDYPIGLETGAYKFDGWYTSPECYDGTEYVSGSKMPDSNEDIYAKWIPKTYTVNMFASYSDMTAYENGDTTIKPLITKTVTHGDIIGSVKDPINGSFSFSGWFYMKNGKRTAYTPLDIPIKSDLNIYAEWNSRSAQPYIIYYALEDRETSADWLNLLKKSAGAAPQDNHSYSVSIGTETRSYIYLKSDGGYHLQIADPSAGYAYQGNMRTFLPKTGQPMEQLYENYNSGYFPTLSSHSLAIKYEEDKDAPVHNVFTFTYVHSSNIEYKVEYRYKDTNELITSLPNGGSVIKTTSNGVVTERFLPVSDYISDSFYKKLIISKDENGNFENNVITFYYTKNSESTYYSVHYMLENLEGDGYTESTTVTEGIAKIGETISLTPTSYNGFTPTGQADLKIGSENEKISLNDGNFSFAIDAGGSELYIYYTRNTENYNIYYLPDGTDISNLENITIPSEFPRPISGSGKFGATVTTSPAVINGYNCTSPEPKSIVLHSNERQNYIVFFYTPLSYTIEYKAWSLGGGSFDITIATDTDYYEYITDD